MLADFLKKFSISREIGTALIRVIRESIFVTYLATSVFLLLSLATFSLEDAGWSHEGSGIPIRNAAGSSGAWLSDFFLSLFGVTAFLFPIILAIYGYLILRRDPNFHDNSLDRIVRWVAAGESMGDLWQVDEPRPLVHVLPMTGQWDAGSRRSTRPTSSRPGWPPARPA